MQCFCSVFCLMDGWPFSRNTLSHAPSVIQIKEVIKKSQVRERKRFVLASSSSAKSLSLHFLHFSAADAQ